MNILNKIYNKTEFFFVFLLLVNIAFIPAVDLPIRGAVSYLSFSNYSFILMVLVLLIGYTKIVEPTDFVIKIEKVSIILIWAIFLFELVKSLSGFKDYFGTYNIFNILELGAYSSFILFLIVSRRALINIKKQG